MSGFEVDSLAFNLSVIVYIILKYVGACHLQKSAIVLEHEVS